MIDHSPSRMRHFTRRLRPIHQHASVILILPSKATHSGVGPASRVKELRIEEPTPTLTPLFFPGPPLPLPCPCSETPTDKECRHDSSKAVIRKTPLTASPGPYSLLTVASGIGCFGNCRQILRGDINGNGGVGGPPKLPSHLIAIADCRTVLLSIRIVLHSSVRLKTSCISIKVLRS